MHNTQWVAPSVCDKSQTVQSHFIKIYQWCSSLSWKTPLQELLLNKSKFQFISFKPYLKKNKKWKNTKQKRRLSLLAHPFYPSTRKAEVGRFEFKTSLNCTVTFRQTRITQGDPDRKKGGGAHSKESCGPAQQVRGIVSHRDWKPEFNTQNSRGKREPIPRSYLWPPHECYGADTNEIF